MKKTEKERAKEKSYLGKMRNRILTETKEEEKKEGGDEHGPELYVGVEEREGGSRGRESGGGGCCQHDGKSATGEGKEELAEWMGRV